MMTLINNSPVANICVILFLFVLARSAVAQNSVEWVQLKLKAEQVEFLLPASHILVYRQKSKIVISGGARDTEFSLLIERRDRAKDHVKLMNYPAKEATRQENGELGGVLAKRYIYDYRESYAEAVYIGSTNYLYSLSGSAENRDVASLGQILGSIRVSGQNLYPAVANQQNVNIQVLTVEDLQSSKEVNDALNTPDASSDLVSFGKVEEEPRDFDGRFSRRLFIVERPKAIYTDSARNSNKQGTILTRVEFKGDGTIGQIVVDKALDSGLAENVAKVARKIKFVPAQIDGKPVNVTRVVKYGFAIY